MNHSPTLFVNTVSNHPPGYNINKPQNWIYGLFFVRFIFSIARPTGCGIAKGAPWTRTKSLAGILFLVSGFQVHFLTARPIPPYKTSGTLTRVYQNQALGDTLGFRIENFNDYVQLPSSLGGGKVKGRASLQLLLDENGKLTDVLIMQLNLKKGISPYITFEKDRTVATEDILYPKKVKKYYPFFFTYAQRNFKFVKAGGQIEKVNVLSIPIRLY